MAMMPVRRDERGMALAVAILALVLIGALVATAFFSGSLERRGSASQLYAVQAFEAADAGVAEVIARWDRARLNPLPAGRSIALDSVALGSGIWYRPSVVRLTPSLALVRAEGVRRSRVGQVLARRLVGALVRLDGPVPGPPAALATLGPVSLAQGARVTGLDTVPPGWASLCDSTVEPVPGVRVPRGTAVGGSAVDGHPAILRDTALAPPSFTDFGIDSFDSLAARADRVVGGSVGPIAPSLVGPGGGCAVGATDNWGEPHPAAIAACSGWLPIIYAPGDLELTGGRGQGVLLVRGDLELSGGVQFAGPVVVLGAVRTSGAGGVILGGLWVRNGPATLGGASVVAHSGCAVRRATAGAAEARPIRERSWLQLF